MGLPGLLEGLGPIELDAAVDCLGVGEGELPHVAGVGFVGAKGEVGDQGEDAVEHLSIPELDQLGDAAP